MNAPANASALTVEDFNIRGARAATPKHYGEALLEPTALYTGPLLRVLENPALAGAIHSLSHVTGGGIAANLARVLPGDRCGCRSDDPLIQVGGLRPGLGQYRSSAAPLIVPRLFKVRDR